jgi:hypothetical protein
MGLIWNQNSDFAMSLFCTLKLLQELRNVHALMDGLQLLAHCHSCVIALIMIPRAQIPFVHAKE